MPLVRTLPEMLGTDRYRDVLARPGEAENEVPYASANVGVRSSWLDPRRDRATLSGLLRDSDVFFHNRRQQFVSEIGMGPADAAAERPGLVYVTISLRGLDGPWAGRPGLDQSAGSVTGIMLAEGPGPGYLRSWW